MNNHNLVLGFFYAFRATPQQGQVLLAEGAFKDFAAEDSLGAVFYHALLLPIAAAFVSALGGFIG